MFEQHHLRLADEDEEWSIVLDTPFIIVKDIKIGNQQIPPRIHKSVRSFEDSSFTVDIRWQTTLTFHIGIQDLPEALHLRSHHS